MRFGLVYSSPWIYDMLLFVLYHGKPWRRFQKVASHIPSGSSVVDLCAGTSMLYRQLLDKNVTYKALEINPRLVRHLQAKKIEAICTDIRRDRILEADVVVMCSSLYHFGTEAAGMLRKMMESAREKVIILEPVRHMSKSHFALISGLSRWASTVDGIIPHTYFDLESLSSVLHSVPGLVSMEIISNGRDVLAVFQRNSSSTSS